MWTNYTRPAEVFCCCLLRLPSRMVLLALAVTTQCLVTDSFSPSTSKASSFPWWRIRTEKILFSKGGRIFRCTVITMRTTEFRYMLSDQPRFYRPRPLRKRNWAFIGLNGPSLSCHERCTNPIDTLLISKRAQGSCCSESGI